MTVRLLILLLCFWGNYTFAQKQEVSGKVVDAKTGEALPFVNIVINDSQHGGTTDIDGKFSLLHPEAIEYLSLSYVGYKPKVVEVRDKYSGLIIEIQPEPIILPEVEVLPGENPAHRIIKNVVNNREENDPENLSSFSYTSYDKMIFTADTTALLDSLKAQPDTSVVDSSDVRLKEFLDKQHFFIMETVAKRKFLAPDKNYEKIVASKVSGFKDPIFVFLLSQLSSFSFYDDVFTISDKNYINPISRGSTNKYFFNLEDTTYTERGDTVFIISFRPLRNTNFDGLKGVLSINTYKWAIQNVRAAPAVDEGGISIEIQQLNELVDGEHWFPVQVNNNVTLHFAQANTFDIVAIGRSYFKEIELDPEIVRREFSNIEVEVADSAYVRDESYWKRFRADSLSARDTLTYHVIDSIGQKYDFDKISRTAFSLSRGKLPWKFVDINLNRIFSYNDYEGLQLGLGLHTNEKVSRRFGFGGYFGYGFGNDQLKYGADASIILHRKSMLEAKFSYINDAVECGRVSFFNEELVLTKPEQYRSFLIDHMTPLVEWKGSLGFKTMKYLNLHLGFSQSWKESGKDYQFRIANNEVAAFFDEFYFSEIQIGLRYAYGEKFLVNNWRRISLGTNYPVVWFLYSRGLDEIPYGDFEYNRYDLKISKSFYIPYLGKTSLTGRAGLIRGDIPYCNLYNGRGSYRGVGIYAPASFSTMRMNEFLSDRYISLFMSHNFGNLLLNKEHFKPEIVIAANLGFGSLDNEESHYNISYHTMEKGYYESGLLLQNLLRLPFTGFGVGAFYRYGPYALEGIDNWSFKYSILFHF